MGRRSSNSSPSTGAATSATHDRTVRGQTRPSRRHVRDPWALALATPTRPVAGRPDGRSSEIDLVNWLQGHLGFGAGLLLALLTAPVGVSGAVFLLPFQLDVLRVPSPAVTPTNLLFNIVSVPGALLRYHSHGQLRGPLVRQLLTATVPGVVLGALIRVYLVPDTGAFRLIVAAVLLPLGLWLCWPSRPAARTKQQPPPPSKAPVARTRLDRRRCQRTALAVARFSGLSSSVSGCRSPLSHQQLSPRPFSPPQSASPSTPCSP